MKATTLTVLYCTESKEVKGIAEEGQYWGAPESVKPFEGTLEEFFKEYPDYDTEENRKTFRYEEESDTTE